MNPTSNLNLSSWVPSASETLLLLVVRALDLDPCLCRWWWWRRWWWWCFLSWSLPSPPVPSFLLLLSASSSGCERFLLVPPLPLCLFFVTAAVQTLSPVRPSGFAMVPPLSLGEILLDTMLFLGSSRSIILASARLCSAVRAAAGSPITVAAIVGSRSTRGSQARLVCPSLHSVGLVGILREPDSHQFLSR